MKILQNLLKNNRDAVFNLIKFQAKGLRLYWKETPAYVLFVEHQQIIYLLKIKIAALDKFSEAAVRGKRLCQSLFLIKLQAWIMIKSILIHECQHK